MGVFGSICYHWHIAFCAEVRLDTYMYLRKYISLHVRELPYFMPEKLCLCSYNLR